MTSSDANDTQWNMGNSTDNHEDFSRGNQNIALRTGERSTSSQSRYRQGEVETQVRPIGTNDSDASSGSFIVCEKERDTLSSNNSIGTVRNLADVQDVGSSSSTPVERTRLKMNPWNDFQHKYKGVGITKQEMLELYRWTPARTDLEAQGLSASNIRDQFRDYLRSSRNARGRTFRDMPTVPE